MTAQQLSNKIVEAFNRHDAGTLAELHTSDVVAYDPQYAEPLHGRDAIRKDLEDFFTSFPDISITISSVIENGNTVAHEATIRGTNQGPLVTPSGSLPATGKPCTIRAGFFYSTDEQGLIKESRRYYDLAGMVEQLGLSEATTG